MILLRSALFNLYFFGLTAILCIVGTAVRIASPQRTLLIPTVWARWIVAGLRIICGIKLEIIGKNRLPLSGPALLASQHQSAFDTIVWLTLLPRCCYVVKRELTLIPLFGGMMRPAGMIVIDRKAGAAAIRHLMHEADRAKREARQVVIFPEGTRSDPDRLLPLQPGIAAMATRTRLPVIPVLTDSGHCWGRRSFRKRPGVIHIALLPPIQPGVGREGLMAGLTAAYHQKIPLTAVDNSVDRPQLGLAGE